MIGQPLLEKSRASRPVRSTAKNEMAWRRVYTVVNDKKAAAFLIGEWKLGQGNRERLNQGS
jgi:hypothetical protein